MGEFHGQRSLVGYHPWGCRMVGPDIVTKQQEIHIEILSQEIAFLP